MLVGKTPGRVLLGISSTALAVALVGCQSGETAAPVTNTVTTVLVSPVTQTGTAITTDTIAGPYVTVMRTTTKPAPAPVTKVVTKTTITTVTKTPDVVTITTEIPATDQETAADDGGRDRLAQADQAADDIQEAASAAGWTGPICDPDVNLHRREAGQDPLGDNQLADTCEANVEKAKTQIANNQPTEDPQPDPTTAPQTVEDEYEHVKKVLGINRDPSSGEVQTVAGCEAHDPNFPPDLCSIVHEEWDN